MLYPSTPTGRRIACACLLLLLGALGRLTMPDALWNQLEPTAHAATYTVTNTNDSGDGSLRQAIINANSVASPEPHNIVFNIPGTGMHTINLLSPLPAITRQVVIDGFTQAQLGDEADVPRVELNGSNAGDGANGLIIAAGGCTVRALIINRFNDAGIRLRTNGSNTIERNIIAPSAPGQSAQGTGIYIEPGSPANTITLNRIGNNRSTGLRVESNSNYIKTNFIGTDITHVNRIPNGIAIVIVNSGANQLIENFINYNDQGVVIFNGSGNNLTLNQISKNGGLGVVIQGSGSVNNKLANNSIADNGDTLGSTSATGIDLSGDGVTPNDANDTDTGPNNLQNFPVLNKVRASGFNPINVVGSLNSTPNTNFTLEFFANASCDLSGHGEGDRSFAGTTVTTGGDGNVSFDVTLNATGGPPPANGEFITATATDPAGNTSEFSQCRVAENAGFISTARSFYTVDETSGGVTLIVNRIGGSSGTVSVDYRTFDGTAKAGSDYTARSGTLTFADGETQKSILIQILDDTLAEGAENLSVELINPKGGVVIYTFPIMSVIIDDNELPSRTVYGITNNNHLVSFNAARPDTILSGVNLNGEYLLAIDFRPLTGKLYGLGVSGQLYTINLTTGALTRIGVPSVTGLSNYPDIGFDFNPVTDRIRVVIPSDKRNLQLNPDTGEISSVDAPLAFAAGDANAGRSPFIYGLASSNNFTGASSTTTYGINWTGYFNETQFVTLGSTNGSPVSPSTGQLFTTGLTGAPTTDYAGFDIADTGLAYASLSHPEEGVFAEFFQINFATGLSVHLGTLIDPNHSGVRDIAALLTERVQFKASNFSVNENAGSATINVTRTGNTDATATVNYSSSDGTALAGQDYTATSGTLTFAPGEILKTFSVPLIDDALIEGIETVNLKLTTGSGVPVVGSQSTATLAIMDEPTEAGTNPIDNAQFFVRQHYLDFLGREPDTGGLDFWTNNITKCGSDLLCIHQRRIGTSGAFFIENEFQQTGSFIYRLYKAALGRQPNFAEFSEDRPLVVGGAGLDANKVVFADEFVQRAEFKQKYQSNTTAESFVDALIQTIKTSSAADLSSQRAALINTYNTGSNTNASRSLTVRAAIEDANFKQAEYNPSFVLMQYFGYLRRDPEVGGYLFWLNVLNNGQPNNYRGMVCAFITSSEYQHRFGTQVTRTNRDCSN
jgi:hypothetical protein